MTPIKHRTFTHHQYLSLYDMKAVLRRNRYAIHRQTNCQRIIFLFIIIINNKTYRRERIVSDVSSLGLWRCCCRLRHSEVDSSASEWLCRARLRHRLNTDNLYQLLANIRTPRSWHFIHKNRYLTIQKLSSNVFTSFAAHINPIHSQARGPIVPHREASGVVGRVSRWWLRSNCLVFTFRSVGRLRVLASTTLLLAPPRGSIKCDNGVNWRQLTWSSKLARPRGKNDSYQQRNLQIIMIPTSSITYGLEWSLPAAPPTSKNDP